MAKQRLLSQSSWLRALDRLFFRPITDDASPMNKKILFFEPYSLASPHFETALELMQNHNDSGDELFIFQCDASLYFCDSNPSHDLEICLRCIGKGCNGLALISGKPVKRQSFLCLTKIELSFIKNFSLQFKDIDALKAFTFDGMDLGFGAASSLITILKDPRPDTVKHHEHVLRIIKSTLAVYFSFTHHLSSIKPDIVYVFNGRFSIMRVILRLCQKNGVNIGIHERGSSMFKYDIIYNKLPHELSGYRQKIMSQWDAFPNMLERVLTASLFYEQRRNGESQSLPSFSKGMTDLSLPQTWNKNKRNIIIFNSSEDEFASIGPDFNHDPFADQIEALRFIRKFVLDRHEIDIYLRIHPRLQSITNMSVSELYDLASPNFHVIRPESTCSSYTLIDHCDAVLTFGSRTGIEATFWGKPSILIGTATYESFEVAHQVTNKRDLMNAILYYSDVKPKERTLPFGFYMLTYGIPFKHYTPDSFYSGKFKAQLISSDTILSRLSGGKYTANIFWLIFNIVHSHVLSPSVMSTFCLQRLKLASTLISLCTAILTKPQRHVK